MVNVSTVWKLSTLYKRMHAEYNLVRSWHTIRRHFQVNRFAVCKYYSGCETYLGYTLPLGIRMFTNYKNTTRKYKSLYTNLCMTIGHYILIYLTPVPECRLMYDYRSLCPTNVVWCMTIGHYILLYLTLVPECRLMYDYRSLYPTLSHPCAWMSFDVWL